MNREAPKAGEEGQWQDPYPRKRKKSWFVGAMIIIVIYVLSTGPACRLERSGTVSTATLESFYMPLGALARYYQPVGNFMRWYINQWAPGHDSSATGD